MSDQREPEQQQPVGADPNSAVADWFDRHVDTIYRYVARRAGGEVAGELTAETFRIALERYELYDPSRGGERAWLYGIASNLLRHHWRRERRRLRALTRLANASASPAGDPLLILEQGVDAQHELRRVVDVIEALPPDDRDLLILVAVEGCTSGEVAEALGIPAGTVRSRLNRIRAELRAGGAAT